MFRYLTLAAFVTYAAAQLPFSAQCNTALTSVATNPDAAACLSTGPLLTFVNSAIGGSNTSLVTGLNTYLTSMCGAPACSNDTLAAVVQNVTTGCATDLSSLGVTSSIAPMITGVIQQFYPTARKVLCLKDGNDNCVVQTLTNLQTVTGDLTSVGNVLGLLNIDVTDLPTNITCTNCVKAAYNTISADVPSINPDVSSFLSNKCGATFVDGQNPSGVGAASTPSTTPNAALGLRASWSTSVLAGVGASGLVVLSTVYTLLA